MGVYPTGVVNKDGDIDQLIRYFPEDPQNIKQLYGQAQRIDCEYWEQNQHERSFNFGTGMRTKKQVVRKDRDVVVQMVSAKVDLEDARKKGLCFKCGKGHQARQCRRKRNDQKPKDRQVTVRMDHGSTRRYDIQ